MGPETFTDTPKKPDELQKEKLTEAQAARTRPLLNEGVTAGFSSEAAEARGSATTWSEEQEFETWPSDPLAVRRNEDIPR